MAKRKRKSNKEAGKQRRPKPLDEPLPPIPDRRAMEGIMRQLVPELGGAGTPLDAAQEIMHQAFEADSPRRQVALAPRAAPVHHHGRRGRGRRLRGAVPPGMEEHIGRHHLAAEDPEGRSTSAASARFSASSFSRSCSSLMPGSQP